MSSTVTETTPPQGKNITQWVNFFSFLPFSRENYGHWFFFGFLCLIFALHPFGTLYHLEGDNLCQIAYFKILFKPHLAGSVGTSAVKPGVVLTLGGVYALSNFALSNPIFVWVLIVALGSLFTWLTMQWAAKLGGPFAGWAAFGLLFATDFPLHFMRGSSQLFFLTMVLGGLTMLHHGRFRLGLMLLIVSGLFRVEGFFIGLCLLAFLRFKKLLSTQERNLLVLFLSISAIFFVALTALVQGGLHRFAGGRSVGYTLGDTLLNSSLSDGIALIQQLVLSEPLFIFLLPFSFWLLYKKSESRLLASFFLVPVFLLVYKSIFSAALVPRYFAFLIPFSICTGVGGIFHLWSLLSREYSKLYLVGKTVLVLAGLAGGAHAMATEIATIDFTKVSNPSVEDGRFAARSPIIPAGQRVLVDDPLLFTWLIEDSTHFKSALAIQAFTQKSAQAQKEDLSSFDYIYLSVVKEARPFTYFNFIPTNRSWKDPLRQKIIHTLSTGEPSTFGNVQLKRFHLDEARGIIKLDPASQ